jgi:hypothetical protein
MFTFVASGALVLTPISKPSAPNEIEFEERSNDRVRKSTFCADVDSDVGSGVGDSVHGGRTGTGAGMTTGQRLAPQEHISDGHAPCTIVSLALFEEK